MPLSSFLNAAGYNVISDASGDARVYLAGLIQVALSVAGILFFIVILYGGFLWLTAGGNEEQVTKAQAFVKNAVIGLVITLVAFIITRTVGLLLLKSINPNL